MSDQSHNITKVYPSLGLGVVIPKNNTPWVLGNQTIIIPAGFISKEFCIGSALVESFSAAGIYEIVLFEDTGNTEIGRTRFITPNAAGTYSGMNEILFLTDYFLANAEISAKIASNNAGPGSLAMSLKYYTH